MIRTLTTNKTTANIVSIATAKHRQHPIFVVAQQESRELKTMEEGGGRVRLEND